MSSFNFNSRTTSDEVVEALKRDLSGQCIIVTGANSGFGFHSALSLARTGARIVLACRSDNSAQETKNKIEADVPNAILTCICLDLGDFESIRQFAVSFNEQVEEPLKVLLMNAGLGYRGYAETKTGKWEETVGVNHLGHFYLYQQLKERLEAAQPSRVIVVASHSHYMGDAWVKGEECPTAEELKKIIFVPKGSYGLGGDPYQISKRLNVMFATTLAKRMQQEEKQVYAYSLHPASMVNTGFGKTFLVKVAMFFTSLFTRSVPQGAATQTLLAVAEGIEEKSGTYWDECKEKETHEDVQNEELCNRVWELSEMLVQEALDSEASAAAVSSTSSTAEEGQQGEAQEADVQDREEEGGEQEVEAKKVDEEVTE